MRLKAEMTILIKKNLLRIMIGAAAIYIFVTALANICHADYELRLNDGLTLTWREYSIEGSQYCTRKEFGKFCVQKSDVIGLKETDGTGNAAQAHRMNVTPPLKPASAKSADKLSLSGKEVLFEFYSSHESEMQFAYLHDLKDNWRFKKMKKDGNRFYIYHPVDQEIWYEFVAPTNTWYKRDPFNQFIDNDHPYLKLGNSELSTHRNLDVTYVPSEHFDYFTTGDGTKITMLEEIYQDLAENKLSAIFNENIVPIHGKKIRFYGGMFKGVYATAGNAEIIEQNDYPNGHEVIHVLLHKYPHFAPFAEGIAQCVQDAGNRLPLTEPNASLAAKQKVKDGKKLWDVLSNFPANSDYHLAGSFIYFHLFVEKKSTESFVRFLKELKHDLDFNTVRTLYERELGKDMRLDVAKWEQWVESIDERSDVFVNWNKN